VKIVAEDNWNVYEDKANEWRWRRTAPNGEIVGASTEGYKDYDDCVDNAVRNGMPDEDEGEEVGHLLALKKFN